MEVVEEAGQPALHHQLKSFGKGLLTQIRKTLPARNTSRTLYVSGS